MILRALVDFYESMAKVGELPSYGWSNVPVSYLLSIDRDGRLTDVIHTVNTLESGSDKKNSGKPIARIW